MVSYKELQTNLKHNEIKQLLAKFNITVNKNFSKNVSELNKHLQSIRYIGPCSFTAINNFGNNRTNEKDITQTLETDFYKTKQKDKNTRKEMFNIVNAPVVDLYSNTRIGKTHYNPALIESALKQYKHALQVINSINDKPLQNEQWKSYNNKQIKVNNRRFEFDFTKMTTEGVQFIHDNFSKLMSKFFDKITFVQKWQIAYDFQELTRVRELNADSVDFLKQQFMKEGYLESAGCEIEYNEITNSADSFFPVKINELTRLRFYDISEFENLQKIKDKDNTDDPVLKYLIKSEASKDIIDAYKKNKKQTNKVYKKHNGHFWKWICTIPQINLERYQIFNTCDSRTVKLMSDDCCVIYACVQAGIDKETVDQMRSIIKCQSFPMTKLQSIADLLPITFIVNNVYSKHNYVYKSKDKNARTIKLLLMHNHYMLDEHVEVSPFFIKNYKDIINKCSTRPAEKLVKINRYNENCYKTDNTRSYKLKTVLETLMSEGYFEPIHINDILKYKTTLFREKLAPIDNLMYNPKYCCQLKEENKSNKQKFKLEHVVYADFECSTNGLHKEYNVCYESNDGIIKQSYFGPTCAYDFLDSLDNNTLIYFHNLSYDINFIINKLTKITGTPIIKGTRTMLIDGQYHGKNLRFKDTYSIISRKLADFPAMFHLETGPKEVFPYSYYTTDILKDNYHGNIHDALKHIPAKDRDIFIHNVNTIPMCKIDKKHFDMRIYSNYYCQQDVRILREGFESFRNDLLKEFNLDVYEFVSICSIANRYFENEVYFKNKNLYNLAGTPREFISKCVYGGRCMLSNNQKQMTTERVVDFDAGSLYPSACARLYCLEGLPQVIPDNQLDPHFLLNHLFEENQVEPNDKHFISGFFVDIEIKNIGKKYSFPLIVANNELVKQGHNRSSNVCTTMSVDHILLQDLIEFQKCDVKIIRGYYYKNNRDYTIQNVIKRLYTLRAVYKKAGNTVQEIIKLILNSIYGKTILKPIDTKLRFIHKCDEDKFRIQNYNTIVYSEEIPNSDLVCFKMMKPINKHYNFCPLGVNILSMSKRIMNEVFSICEDFRMPIFYQDTDSIHMLYHNLIPLQKLFKAKYNRELCGSDMGQFHPDFAEIDKGHDSIAVKTICCGKKCYLDKLTNDLNHIAFHARMKGVSQDVVGITANEMFPDAIQVVYNNSLFIPKSDYNNDSEFSIQKLYEYLYAGNEVEFELCKGLSPCFNRNTNFTIETKKSFKRKLKF